MRPSDPISVDDVIAGRELTEPRLSPDGRLVAFVASEAGEAHLYVVPVTGGVERRVSPWPVRAGRGLGGGCHDWLPDSSGLVVVARTGELWSLSLDSGDAFRLVTAEPGKSLAAPCVSPEGDGIVMTHDQAQVFVYRLDGTVLRVDRGDHDFVGDPCWWSGRPVWHAWNAPNMPWDESRLVGVDGPVGGSAGVQIQQPRTDSTSQRLGWVDDSTGWLNVTVVDGDTGTIRRANEEFEHASPTWGEGQRSWCFNDGATVVAFARNEHGFGRLCTFDLDSGLVVDRAKAVHGQLSWVGDTLVAVRTGGKTPTQIVVYDTSNPDPQVPWPRRTLVVGSTVDWEGHRALVEPELLDVAARDGARLHARLYRAPTPNGRLLCWVHGGPTDQWPVTFMPRLNYWIDRGYDVLVPDHRGSTGFGRRYTQQLRGRWAELDADDVADVLRHRAHDPRRIALMGSSAGGLNVLSVATRNAGLAAAAVVAYPVTDIAALDVTTHRFEAHYNRSLVGDVRTTAIASLERSPVNNVSRLVATPVLVMHGTSDPVVSIEQSREFARVLAEAGGNVELVEFDGEGHGFRLVENKVREYRLTEDFLNAHLA